MGAIEHFATAGLRPREQLPFWNRLASETFSGVVIDCAAESFPAEMWRWSLGELTLLRPCSPAAIVHRTLPARQVGERVVLQLQHRGRSRAILSGGEHELSNGDFALRAGRGDARLALSDANEMLVVEMPRAAIGGRLADLDAAMERRIPGHTPGARLLHDFLLSLWRQGDAPASDHDWRAGAGGVFLDLLPPALRHHAQCLPRPPLTGACGWRATAGGGAAGIALASPRLRPSARRRAPLDR